MRVRSRMRIIAAAVLAVIVTVPQVPSGQSRYRTLDDRFTPPQFVNADGWTARAAYLREHVLASAGLLPLPEKTTLHPSVFGEVRRADYSVSKVYFESLPGFFVTGNLYRPIGDGPLPADLSPHGHWAYGRLENTVINSGPGRAINLARRGFVVFTYDMVGYNDSQQVPHTFSGQREYMWGLSLSGLQLWDSIRALDFLESLPYVRREAIGMTGESGGGTQTFLASAVDDRVAAAVPVNMISLHMQGGCLCENPPGLRLDTTNVEIAATIAPRPLLMVSATGDWTDQTLESEYPAVRSIYALLDADDHVQAVRFTAEHNYNKDSREAMYAWMARWLQHAPADTHRPESPFTPDPLPDLLVFHNRTLPEGALDAQSVTAAWIDAARRQLTTTSREVRGAALRHALAFEDLAPAPDPTVASRDRQLVLLAGDGAGMLESSLKAAGYSTRTVQFRPFDAAAAAKVRHFETYNRTAASQRVLDIVMEARAHPGAALVASGDAALAGAFAAAVAPLRLSVLDVDRFDTRDDDDFLDHVYIPGLRRAGDFQTAADIALGTLVFHNAGSSFAASRARVQSDKLTAEEIVALLR